MNPLWFWGVGALIGGAAMLAGWAHVAAFMRDVERQSRGHW